MESSNKGLIIGLSIGAVVLLVGGALLFMNANQQSPTTDTNTQTQTPSTSNNATNGSNQNQGQTAEPITAEVTVTYTANGFEPSSVGPVKVGTVVKFVNNSSSGMEVASDPHPSHTDYTAFDSNTAVQPGGSYSFTFDKVGTWGFHNHLNPTLKGSVSVEN